MCTLLLEENSKFDREFYVVTDASGYGTGRFVFQFDDNGNPVIVTMVSRLLKRAELKYHTCEREL